MEREILLLGLLQGQEIYGYQINAMIDTHVGPSLRLTKPTAYRILHNLADQGFITFREEKEGNRPTRRTYRITPKGEEELIRKLQESLRSFIPMENESAIGLAFLDLLPLQERITLLDIRRSAIEKLLDPLLESEEENGTFRFVKENRILHLSAELAWLKDIIREMEEPM